MTRNLIEGAVNKSRQAQEQGPIDRMALEGKTQFVILRAHVQMSAQRRNGEAAPDIQDLLRQADELRDALQYLRWDSVVDAAATLIAMAARLATEGNPVILSVRTGKRLDGPNTTYTGGRA